MNILVTGANGQLGNEMRRLGAGPDHHFIFTDVNEIPGVETVHLDITDLEAVRLITESEKVDVIVNCAAYTNVEKAEDDLTLADLLNHTAPGNLARAAKERDALLIHISTDYVFSGKAFRPVREDDQTDPQSVYGATKLAGEKAVADSGCRSIIIRTAWLYSPYGKNFVKTMLNLTAEKESINVVCDQIGTPTYAADLAGLILHIIGSGNPVTGIYHFSNEGAISWYDFAQTICRLSGHKCRISSCMSSEFPAKAARPHYSVLDKSLVKKTFGITVPYWEDSLEDCLKRLG